MSRLNKWLKALPVIKTILETPSRLQGTMLRDQLFDYSLLAFKRNVRGVTDLMRQQPLTISLTTYGERIHNVHLVIESLMNQTFLADRIILWLSKDEFDAENIPEMLKKQQEYGLIVKFCDDLKSYKKLVPALNDYPSDLIITADDDILYPINHVERLYRAYLQEPNIIHCHRAHLMRFDKVDRLLPYQKWDYETEYSLPSLKIFPTTGSGALYFPGCFSSDVTDQALFMTLCPSADDIWFKFMSLKEGVLCKTLMPNFCADEFISPPESGDDVLWRKNLTQNDIQMNSLVKHFGEGILDSLKAE